MHTTAPDSHQQVRQQAGNPCSCRTPSFSGRVPALERRKPTAKRPRVYPPVVSPERLLKQVPAVSGLAKPVIHQLNNIVFAIRMNAQLVLEDQEPGDSIAAPCLKDILAATDKAEQLAGKMARMCQVTTDTVQPLDPLGLFRDIIDSIRQEGACPLSLSATAKEHVHLSANPRHVYLLLTGMAQYLYSYGVSHIEAVLEQAGGYATEFPVTPLQVSTGGRVNDYHLVVSAQGADADSSDYSPRVDHALDMAQNMARQLGTRLAAQPLDTIGNISLRWSFSARRISH